MTLSINSALKWNKEKLQAILAILTIGAVSLVVFYISLHGMSSFDGAMNLQVPVSLSEYGKYATSYDGFTEFDHSIQTGPTVLVPIALLFLAFGKSFFMANFVMLVYATGLLIVSYLLAKRFVGPWFALLAPIMIGLVPKFFTISISHYGEVPGLFFVLLAVLLFDRVSGNKKKLIIFLSGLALGFALLTKTVFLIALPSFLLIIVLDLLRAKRTSIVSYVLFFVAIPLPYALFEFFKLVKLGWAGYQSWWQLELGEIFQQAGVSQGFSDTAGIFNKFSNHLSLLAGYLRIPSWLIILLLLAMISVAAIELTRLFRKNDRNVKSLSLLLLSSITTSYFLWWLLITPTSRAWDRRIIAGNLLLALLVVVALGYFYEIFIRSSRAKKILSLVPFVVTLSSIIATEFFLVPLVPKQVAPSLQRDSIYRIAGEISSLPPDATVYGIGWWQAPRLSFLSGRTFTNLAAHVPPAGVLHEAYLAIDREAYLLGRDTIDAWLERTDYELIYSGDDNFLYRLSIFKG